MKKIILTVITKPKEQLRLKMYQAEYEIDGVYAITIGFETIEELEKYCESENITDYRIVK